MAREPDAVKMGQKCSCHPPPPHSLPHAANVVRKYINLRPTLRIAAGFKNNLVMAGIGSLAFAALAPLPTLAEPGITLQDSFAAGRYSHDGSDGNHPWAALTAAGNGIFYGTTSNGAANNKGGIFSFDSATGSITLQASFAADGSNGSYPNAALTAAGNGLFYGTAVAGGAGGRGAIFSFDSATGSITLQGSFAADGSNGAAPYAALTPAANGLYYGTTEQGGAGFSGVIFSFDPATGAITVQNSFDFDGSEGAGPNAALIAAGNGLFYGTTAAGGANFKGAVFAFDSATGSISLQGSFDGSNGEAPKAALTPAGNGLYYGTTVFGGAYNTGAIFAFDSGVRDSNPVPGPLPLMGAGAAFGWSRRLRRRIQPVRPVFPIGR